MKNNIFHQLPKSIESTSIHYLTELKTNYHSSPTKNQTTTSMITMKCSNDNKVPQSLNSSSTTTINETI